MNIPEDMQLSFTLFLATFFHLSLQSLLLYILFGST